MPDNNCIFCRIIGRELPSQIVYEDDMVLAIKDIQPVAPVHILLISKAHIASLNEVGNEQISLLAHIQMKAAQIAAEQGIGESGYRLVNNCGAEGGQTVPHLHYHLLGGRSMIWPPG